MATSNRIFTTGVFDHEFTPAATLLLGVSAALVSSRIVPSSYFDVVFARSRWSPLTFLEISSLHDITVNLLMVIFFFALGLELGREFASGPLARVRSSLPAVCGAAGGMLVTATGSLALGGILHSSALRRGWGVPMATDVAFTLAILAVAGRRLPPHVRVFLLTLAICDDVLSVIVLSLSGNAHVRWWGLALAAVVIASIVGTRQRTHSALVVAWVVTLWLAFALANLEPALAGLVAGVALRASAPGHASFERFATRVSVGIVLPLYAFVACGLTWSHLSVRGAVGTVIIATVAIRLIGKTLGITAGVKLAYTTKIDHSVRMPLSLLATLGLLCAIGFTVPLFFVTRIFGANTPLYDAFAVGLLSSSLIAAIVGGLLVHFHRPTE